MGPVALSAVMMHTGGMTTHGVPTVGEQKRLKTLGANLRKARRESREFDALKIEREISSLHAAIGITE